MQKRYLYAILIENRFELLDDINPAWITNLTVSKINQCIWNIRNQNKDITIDNVKTEIDNCIKGPVKNILLSEINNLEKEIIIVSDNLKDELRREYENYQYNFLMTKLADKNLSNESKNDYIKTVFDCVYGVWDNQSLIELNEQIREYKKNIDAGLDSKFVENSIDVSGHSILNQFFANKIRPGLIFIGGLPGFGKSIVAAEIANYLATLKKHTLLFGFDDNDEIWTNKCMANRFNINYTSLTDMKLSERQKSYINPEAHNYVWLKTKSMNIQDLERFIRRQLAYKKIDCIIIDHMRKILHNYSQEAMELTLISNVLHNISKDFVIPVIAFHQLNNKELSEQGEVRPYLKHLFGAGAMEQDGSLIVLLGGRKDSDTKIAYCDKTRNSDNYFFSYELDRVNYRIRT